MIARLLAIATTAAVAVVVAAGAPARAAVVELRVDSATNPVPLFDGAVNTLPHSVDGGDGSGPHPCNGPSATTPSATATGALDDAMRGAGLPWRGNWDPSFRDFFIDRIGPYASAAPDRYWSLTVNGHFSAGGCLTEVESGDTVRFTYGPLFAEPAAPSGPAAPGGPRSEGAGTGAVPVPIPDLTRRKMRGIAARAAAYLRRGPGGIGADWARLALTVRRGRDPGPAAAPLIRGRLGQLQNGSIEADVNATAMAVLALERRRPRAAASAARWLTSIQSPSGGFGFRPGVVADVDTTGLATWALAFAGRGAAARLGAGFVRSAQAADGGFPSVPGGAANAQSTGLGLVALRAAGVGARVRSAMGLSAADFIAALARPDGSISYASAAAPTPTWTTAQALLGLMSRKKLLALSAPAAP